jgi:hypothetical protein
MERISIFQKIQFAIAVLPILLISIMDIFELDAHELMLVDYVLAILTSILFLFYIMVSDHFKKGWLTTVFIVVAIIHFLVFMVTYFDAYSWDESLYYFLYTYLILSIALFIGIPGFLVHQEIKKGQHKNSQFNDFIFGLLHHDSGKKRTSFKEKSKPHQSSVPMTNRSNDKTVTFSPPSFASQDYTEDVTETQAIIEDEIPPIGKRESTTSKIRRRRSRFEEFIEQKDLEYRKNRQDDKEEIHEIKKETDKVNLKVENERMERLIAQAQNDKALALLRMDMEVGLNNIKTALEYFIKETGLSIKEIYHYIDMNFQDFKLAMEKDKHELLMKIQETQYLIEMKDQKTLHLLKVSENRILLNQASIDRENLERFHNFENKISDTFNAINTKFSDALNRLQISSLQQYHQLDLKTENSNHRVEILQQSQDHLKSWLQNTQQLMQQGVSYKLSEFGNELQFIKQIHEKNSENLMLSVANMDYRNKYAFLKSQEDIGNKLHQMEQMYQQKKLEMSSNPNIETQIKIRELQDEKRDYERQLSNTYDAAKKRDLRESFIYVEGQINYLRAGLG